MVEPLGGGDGPLRRPGVVLPARLRDQRAGVGDAAGMRELQRLAEPALEEAVVRRTPPHPAAHGRFEGELGVHPGERLGLLGQLDRLLHRRPHGLAVELQRVHPADRMPHPGVVRGELGGAAKLREGVVEIEARQREGGGAAQPPQRSLREPLALVIAVAPCQLRDAGRDRLRVVVCQRAGAAVRRAVGLEPAREGGVQACAARLRQAAVGDLAGECVLEDELGVRGADEAALDQGPHLRARAGQRGQARRGERPADHRGRLERRLRLGRKEVDAGGEDALDRVRDAEVEPVAAQRPPARSPLEQPPVEEVCEHLLDEERVSLRVAGDQVERALVHREARERCLDELGHLIVAEALEAHHLGRGQRSPLGPRRCEQEHRALRIREDALEHLDQRRSGPVQILDDHHRRAVRAQLRDQSHPLVLQLQERRPRVEIAGDVETECEAEDLAAGEPLQEVVGRVLLAQAELLSQHVCERAVGHAAAVGETAPEPKRRPRRKPRSQPADERRLAHARLAHDEGEARAPFRARARDDVLEPPELACAAHEPRFRAVPGAWASGCAHPQELPAGDAAVLPLRLDRPRLAELERAGDDGRGALPHEHVAGLRRLFEARGHVHRVAGRERAALARAADHDLARVHADPQ